MCVVYVWVCEHKICLSGFVFLFIVDIWFSLAVLFPTNFLTTAKTNTHQHMQTIIYSDDVILMRCVYKFFFSLFFAQYFTNFALYTPHFYAFMKLILFARKLIYSKAFYCTHKKKIPSPLYWVFVCVFGEWCRLGFARTGATNVLFRSYST